jgi:hypothetical protein
VRAARSFARKGTRESLCCKPTHAGRSGGNGVREWLDRLERLERAPLDLGEKIFLDAGPIDRGNFSLRRFAR